MNDDERQTFIDWLGGYAAYNEWIEEMQSQESPSGESTPPWEKGGKQPEDYTLEEYLMLSDDPQHAFRETFESEKAFNEWMNSNTETPDIEGDDLFAGMDLEDFTLEDYAALDIVEAAAFRDKYSDSEAEFEAWLESQWEIPDLDEFKGFGFFLIEIR